MLTIAKEDVDAVRPCFDSTSAIITALSEKKIVDIVNGYYRNITRIRISQMLALMKAGKAKPAEKIRKDIAERRL